MKAEKKVTKWEEVTVLKCRFCGDLYETPSNNLHIILVPNKRHTSYRVCEFCLERDPEPNYPEGMRETRE